MMHVRLGYVAMSMNIKNCSPSQTMTYTRFEQLANREAAIKRLELLSNSNLENNLRLLKHNVAHDISFFRLSSRLIPLATHEELKDWNYIQAVQDKLNELGEFIAKHELRVDFHPDHFVLLNSPRKEVLVGSIENLKMHYRLLKGMNVDPVHRCVMHVGGNYKKREEALERFVSNWGMVPTALQQMIMLENDDKSFDVNDTLYLCQKLNIPLVFDYHHHLAHHGEDTKWETEWERVVSTWSNSPLPIKMHISSPKSEKDFRSHADYIDKDMFLTFLRTIKGSVEQIDCMIEAKQKDNALFRLMRELKKEEDIKLTSQASFFVK